MRIIFLDVDGVINSDETEDRYCGWIGIDSTLVKKLRIIYDKSNEVEETRIVISSSWRYEKIRKHYQSDGSYDYLLSRLKEEDMEVIGNTPMDKQSGWHRGREILSWLEETDIDVSTFVILDDEKFDFLEEGINLEKNLVITRSFEDEGLTDKSVDRALKILNGEELNTNIFGDKIDDNIPETASDFTK